MDRQLRELRRRAATGDVDAALQYYFARKRSQNYDDTSATPVSISIERPRMHGIVEVYPISLYELYIRTPINQAGFLVFNVDYSLRVRYYYYPDIGWVPFPPETVEHSRQHLQKYLKERKHDQMEDHRIDLDLRYYFPSLARDRENRCFLCDKVVEPNTLHLMRAGYGIQPATERATKYVYDTLQSLCADFSKEHRELMLRQHRGYLNQRMEEVEKKLNEQKELLTQLEHNLAHLVIEEAQLYPD